LLSGLNWYKGDFHVHTPFSRCFKDNGVTARDLLAAASELDFVVIADHNTFDGYLHLMEYREALKPVIFPGVELKVPCGYAGLSLIVVLSPEFGPLELEGFLREVGVFGRNKGESGGILPTSLPQLAETVSKYDGIVLWSKVHSVEGILAGVDLQQREYILSLKWPVNLIALGEEEQQGGCPAVWGSNAHRVREIGRTVTLVKLENPDFAGLKFALQDPEARVRPGSKPGDLAHPCILSLKVSGGFLAGQEFHFNPGLNCLIGARGTGKSTLLKLLRFVLGVSDNREQQYLIGLGEVEASLLTSEGEPLRVRRAAGGESRVYDRLGRTVNADLGAYASIFAQGEVEGVVLEPEFQLKLLDSLWAASSRLQAKAQISSGLRENGNELEEVSQGLDELQECLAAKSLLEKRLAELDSLPLVDIQARLTEREREVQVLAGTAEIIRQNLRCVNKLPCRGGISSRLLAKPLQRTTIIVQELNAVWAEAEQELAEFRLEMESRHTGLEEEYRDLLGGCSDTRVRKLLQERQQIQSELVRLEPLEVSLKELSLQVNSLKQERSELLQKWTSLGEGIYLQRLTAAAELNRRLGPYVKVEVKPGAHSLPFRAFLSRRLGNQAASAVRAIESKVSPARLGELIVSGDAAELARSSGLSLERCRRLLGTLNNRKDLIQEIMEGGKDAFQRRARRYGQMAP